MRRKSICKGIVSLGSERGRKRNEKKVRHRETDKVKWYRRDDYLSIFSAMNKQ